jgi:hypothetical protein
MDLVNLIKRDVTDPNLNYNMFQDALITAFNDCIPLKEIKFHKHKHEKSEWISFGLIKSIKYRDNLYKQMKQTTANSDEILCIKQNLTVYNRILKRSIRQAKTSYYYNRFNNCAGDSQENLEYYK